METKNIYKNGLFGRCPICKEIFKISCIKCQSDDSFVDSGRSNHVLCQNCGTHNHLTCTKAGCNHAPLQYRTPKNEDEKKRIELYIEIKKDKNKDQRSFDIKENRSRSIVQLVEILQDGTYSVPAMKKHSKISADFSESFSNLKVKKNISKPQSNLQGGERRIVNQFYDEVDDDGYIDKKTVFEVIYDEKVFSNCTICGRVDFEIKCTRCNSTDKFNLNYEALSCQCGNQMKVAICDCGAKLSYQDLFLKSEDVNWQFSRSKSYYNYCKGRMTVFSTCPVCNIFSAEQCSVCGSKVNFGLPNEHNEVFCKNCGTINKFNCENLRCDQALKTLKNPESTEQKFEWLQKVMNLKKEAIRKIAVSRMQDTDFLPTDFVEEIKIKNQKMLTDSFMNEVKKEVKAQSVIQQSIIKYNRRRLLGPGFYFFIVTLLIIIGLLAYEVNKYQNENELQRAYRQMNKK